MSNPKEEVTNSDTLSAIQDTNTGDNIEAQMETVIDSFIANNPPKDEDSKKAETRETKVEEKTNQDSEKGEEEIDEELLERAVRAGLTMNEAKSFSSKELLESMVGKLEAKPVSLDTTPTSTEDAQEGVGELDDLNLDPNVWDEELVKAFDAVKKIAKKYGDELAALRSAGESAKAEDYFSTKFSSLDSEYRDAFGGAKPNAEQSAARAKVMSKYKVLEAGYQSLGDKVSHDQLFNEAVESVVGTPKPSRKSSLEKRNALSLSRPSHGGARGDDMASVDDVKAMVAASISKYYD